MPPRPSRFPSRSLYSVVPSAFISDIDVFTEIRIRVICDFFLKVNSSMEEAFRPVSVL